MIRITVLCSIGGTFPRMIDYLSRYKVIVFDLGGTLMEYSGMPLNWSEYYFKGFKTVSENHNLFLSDNEIQISSEILKAFNPRHTGRENEIAPEVLFEQAISHWQNKVDIETVINDFFSGLELHPLIYEYSYKTIDDVKQNGCMTAVLTDLPNGMPDELFKKSIPELLSRIDLYVSSQSCGYRKPNARGISYITDYFGVENSNLLLVGDEEKDHRTAINAGCDYMFIEDYLKTTFRKT